MGRLEPLEARTLLNATIDVDVAGRLTYRTDLGAASAVRVSEVGGVYTFAVGAADAPIDLTSNAAGLVVSGSGTRSVAVTGPSALEIDALADADSILLASASVPATIALRADDVLVTVGDPADPRGLGALPAAVAVAGSPTSSNSRLVVDDSGWNADSPWRPVPYWPLFFDHDYFRLTKDSVESRDGVGLLSYSGVSALTLRGTSAFGPTSRTYLVVSSTADGVDTRIDLSAGVFPQYIRVLGTSAAATSRLTILGGHNYMSTIIESSASPVTYQSSPGSSGSEFFVDAAGMTAASAIVIDGGEGGGRLGIDSDGLPITTANFQLGAGAIVFTPPPPQGGTVRFSNVSDVDVYNVPQAPSVVVSNTLDVVAGQTLYDVVAATITTALPNATTADFNPLIIWGDVSQVDGSYVVADPGDPTRFYIVGSHRFEQAGSYTPGVIMQTSGSRTATSIVDGVAIQFRYASGHQFSSNALAIAGDLQQGQSRTDSIINDNKPYMAGRITAAEGAARIVAYATPEVGGGAPIVIGRSVSGPFGLWELRPDVPLPDGRYTIQVQTFNDVAHIASNLITLASGLVVDTVGPRVVGVQFLPGRGQVVVSYRDSGGVDDAGTGVVTYPETYEFSQLANPIRGYHPPAQWTVTSFVDLPTRRRNAPQRVSVQINRGRPIRGGAYLLLLQASSGVTDGAGNPLQGASAFRLSALHGKVRPARAVAAPPIHRPQSPGRPPLRPPIEL